MSTHLPGAAGANDFAADLEAAGLRPDEPGVRDLLGALTAPPSAGELSAEQAALAMFRASLGVPSPVPTAPVPPPQQAPARATRRPRSAGWRIRAGLAAAAILTAAGTVGAAYAAALPPPVQHLAYQVLGFAGVPDSHHQDLPQKHQGAHPSAPVTGHGTGPVSPAPTGPAGGSPAAPSSPLPSPSGHAPAPSWHVSIAAGEHQIAAGGTAVLVASVTQAGHRVSGATVRLLERPAGQVSWRTAGTASTSASGLATVRVGDLRTNADFRFAGNAGATSADVTITVVPAITLRPLSQPGDQRRTALIARSPFARPGDVVVLQLRSGSSWIALKSRRLGVHEQRIFLVSSRLAAGRTFRVTLAATRVHAASVSTSITLP